MRAVDLIRRKRDGAELDQRAIDFLVRGATDGSIPDYQTAAWLMAVVLRGMTANETLWLTDAMVRSGARLDLSEIAGVKVDKHSTGGVGDKTSLILAPLAAACGALVPMMSGRGLGHTGGTLDKLDSIPGFRTALPAPDVRAALRDVGCVLVGQTAEIAPADKRLYALRDVTATVESVPLITASIMSKKIAEGIDALVIDVKAGSGAFMKTMDEAKGLARSLVSVGNQAGVRTHAVLTSMDTPLGRAVGNALEVVESIETLKGRGPADLEHLSVVLAARMLVLAGAAPSEADAERRVRGAIASGAGVEKFRHIIERQGGDPRVVDDYDRLPRASARHIVGAPRAGYLTRVDAEKVGNASMVLGAGRERAEDQIDPGAGILLHAKPGDPVERGQPILELSYNDERRREAAVALAEQAIEVGDQPPVPQPLILGSLA